MTYITIFKTDEGWNGFQLGVRPRKCENVGTQTETTYVDQWFTPKDWLAKSDWDKVSLTSGSKNYSVDISSLTNRDLYFYFHTAGLNIKISKIWFE